MNLLTRRIAPIALLLVSGTAMAQTIESPPPTLHLPDVVIYGRDILQMRRLKEMEAFHPILPDLMDSPFRNRKESITRSYPKEPFRKGMRDTREWILIAKGGYGTFQTKSLDLYHGLNLRHFHWLLSEEGIWRDSYNGIPNTEEKGYDLKVKGGFRPDERLNGFFEASSMEKKFGYYGSTDSLSRGTFSSLGGGGGAEGGWREGKTLKIHGMMKKISLEREGVRKMERNEGEFFTEISTPLDPHILTFRSGYSFHDPKPDLFSLQGKIVLSLPFKTTGHLGLGYYNFEKGDEREVRIYPSLSITYPLQNLSLFLSYDPKVFFRGSESLFGENPFTGSLLSRVWDIQNDLSLGLTGRIHPVQGKVFIGIEKRKNMPVWKNSNGLFYLDEVAKVSVRKGMISLEWNLLENLSLPTSFSFEEFEDDGNLFDPFPYQSKIKSEIGIRYNPWKGTKTELDLSYFGKRWTENEEEIKPYTLMSLGLSQELVSHLALWGRAGNLLDTSYEIWKGYTMPGISFSSGLEFKW